MGIRSTFQRWEDQLLLSPKLIYIFVSAVYYGFYLFRGKFITTYLGLSKQQYGDIAAVMAIVSFAFMTVWGTFADALGRHRLVLAFLCMALVGSFELNLLTSQVQSVSARFYLTAVVFSVYSVFASGILPLTDYLTLRLLSSRPGFSRDMYGRQRLWGTISYGCTSYLVGLCNEKLGITSLYYLLPILCAICVLSLFAVAPPDSPKPLSELFALLRSSSASKVEKAPSSPSGDAAAEKPVMSGDSGSRTNLLADDKKEQPGTESVAIASPAASGAAQPAGGKERASPLLQLLKNPNYMFMLFVVFMTGCSRSVMTTFLSLYWQDDMKIPDSRTGTAANFGIATEVVIFFFGPPMIRIFGTYWLLIFAQGASVVRCWAYYVLPKDPSNYWIVYLIELLKGVAFGCTQLSGVKLASEAAPEGLEATAQALYTAIYSQLPAVLTAIAGGRIYHRYGGTHLFLTTAIISSAALLLFTAKYILDGSIRIPGLSWRRGGKAAKRDEPIHVKPSVTERV